MPLSRITLRQYEAFAAVADLLNFAAAGKQMGLSASAISQLVAELETSTGFRVFDRHTRKVALSSAGRDFLPFAQSALRHGQLAESAAADVLNRSVGMVRVAAPQVLAATALPQAIREFRQMRDKVLIRIVDTAVDDLVEKVLVGDADLAVGPDRLCGREVRRTKAFDSPWVLWCAAGHPLTRRKSLRWPDLRDVVLVAAGRDHERSVAQMHVNAPEGSRIRPVEIVDNITTALGVAAQGLAATLAPAYVASMALPMGLVSLRVRQPEVIRQVCVYQSNVRATSPAAGAFGEFLLEWLPAWPVARRRSQPDVLSPT